MKVLVACENSQSVTHYIAENGHDVISCDSNYDGERGYPHYKGDVFDIIDDGFDIMIAFPPCTYLAKAQIHLLRNEVGRDKKSVEAIDFVKRLYNCSIPRVAIENPIGVLSSEWRKPTQIVSPHLFGDNYKKDVCLWLKRLPVLPVVLSSSQDLGTSSGYAADKPLKYKSVSNHVNSRMSQVEKSKIKSSWDYFPNLSKAVADTWCPKI